MDDAYLLCQRHAGDGIIDALLYRLGLVEIDWQLSGSLLCLRWSDLLQPGDRCLGGGYWEIDYVDNCLELSGRSYDYGEPRWCEITTLLVPQSYRDACAPCLCADTPLALSQTLDATYSFNNSYASLCRAPYGRFRSSLRGLCS